MPKDRLNTNLAIIEELRRLAQKYPDWRFHQLLQNCKANIAGTDLFYEESSITFDRMMDSKI